MAFITKNFDIKTAFMPQKSSANRFYAGVFRSAGANTRLAGRSAAAAITAAFFFCGLNSGAETFSYKHSQGDKFRILSEIQEEYLENGKVISNSQIHNRISTEVIEIKNEEAVHKALFQVIVSSQNSGGLKTFNIENEYTSYFNRDSRGKMTVSRKYAFPSVRNVPVFPARNVQEGETWRENGEEVHDMQGNFGLMDLLRIPFNAQYKYLGLQKWKGKDYPAFLITYKINQQVSDYFESAPHEYLSKNRLKKNTDKEITIASISGETNQTIFWDEQLGQAASSSGSFSLRFNMSNGVVHEFRSKENAEVIYSEKMNKDVLVADIEKELEKYGLSSSGVKKTEEGVSINIEDVQFEGESAVLRASEKQKLNKIIAILKKYSDRDILVAGHTADAGGSAESHINLSQERAQAVAGYLIQEKARPSGRIITKGYGAERPVANNATQEGREKNRRVEIIILEN
ncbi:MAG: OmpA family protein [Spirochaetaceae bacterium]|jgi:outer membrane protein OmpA-like peptidoglycan-associated protein|nr:OmpA family protein [Spirochaetaceae bacterium]